MPGPVADRHVVNTIYTAADTTFVGTNTFSLEFDATINKFKLTASHMPFYDDTGVISIGYAECNNLIPDYLGGKYMVKSAYSGIFLTSMTPTSFWADKLGIQATDFCTTYAYYTYDDHELPDFKWIPGTTCTSQQLLLSGSSVINGGNFSVVPDIITMPAVPSTLTNEIYASKQILETTSETPYYMIDIQSKFQNALYDSFENHSNIIGIVGTYYSQGSFTSGSEDDTIQYTHKGAPLSLSSFRVRILTDKKILATDILGPNNVIFLQLQKAGFQQS
jgi:hypothetical protein